MTTDESPETAEIRDGTEVQPTPDGIERIST
jgi:hypothetical protein